MLAVALGGLMVNLVGAGILLRGERESLNLRAALRHVVADLLGSIGVITSGFPALSAHVVVGGGEDCHDRRRELEELLAHEFGIEHTTLQVDHDRADELVSITSRSES